MRIISPFHDYYDTALGFGQDPALIYHRNVKVKTVNGRDLDPKLTELFRLSSYSYYFKAHFALLGFCGRLYSMYLAPDFVINPESLTTKAARSPVMSREELEAYYDQVFGSSPRRRTRRKWAELEAQGTLISNETFRLLDAPLWLAVATGNPYLFAYQVEVFTNIRLGTVDFQKHFDAYSAFQEIAMYLGSALAKTDDSVRTVGSDEVIAQQKGFGPESFRSSAPSVKKSRRKENRARKKGSESGPPE